jgi:hypothetical protein
MLTSLMVLLAATPVSLHVDLSRNTTARLGPRVRELIEERLQEEGFAVESGAKLKLAVEELHGTLKLSAQVGEFTSTSELRPAIEWPAELGFEVAQRLAVLAHEAEARVPVRAAPVSEDPVLVPVDGEEASSPLAPTLSPAGEREAGIRIGAGMRLGVLVRVPAVDPVLWFHGTLPGHAVEPIVALGVVAAPDTGLFAVEMPLVAGIRVPIVVSSWSLVPELLAGGRLHVYGSSALDANGGARFDPIATLGFSLLRAIGSVRAGARLGVEVSAPREHLQGEAILWSRSAFAFSVMLQLER